jgi:hypothetical protein
LSSANCSFNSRMCGSGVGRAAKDA